MSNLNFLSLYIKNKLVEFNFQAFVAIMSASAIKEIDRLFKSYERAIALLKQYQITAAASDMHGWVGKYSSVICETLMQLSKEEQYKWVKERLVIRLNEYLEKYTDKKTNASYIMSGVEEVVRMREEHDGTDSDDVARRDAAKVIADEAHKILEDAREVMNYAHSAEEDGWEYGYDGRIEAHRTAKAVYNAAYKIYKISKGTLRPAYAIDICKRAIERYDAIIDHVNAIFNSLEAPTL